MTFSAVTPETTQTSAPAVDVDAAEPGTYGRGITTEPAALGQNGQRPD
jgi:hypothetical protein